jgi:hypothetical protein
MTVKKMEITYRFEDHRIDPENDEQMQRIYDALHQMALDLDYPVWWDLPKETKDVDFGMVASHTDEELIKVINVIKECLNA